MSLLQKILRQFACNPNIALLMSGKGSNALAILENQHRYPNLNFVAIISDQARSNAQKLCQQFALDYYYLESPKIGKFDREKYFEQVAIYLRSLQVNTLIYAGFMKITPATFVQEFPGINIHPADLTILDPSGKPKYTGMYAIKDAVKQGEAYIASTAHIVDCEVDAGTPLMVSKKLWLNDDLRTHLEATQNLLKTSSEHLLYPQLLEFLSQGLLASHDLPLFWENISTLA